MGAELFSEKTVWLTAPSHGPSLSRVAGCGPRGLLAHAVAGCGPRSLQILRGLLRVRLPSISTHGSLSPFVLLEHFALLPRVSISILYPKSPVQHLRKGSKLDGVHHSKYFGPKSTPKTLPYLGHFATPLGHKFTRYVNSLLVLPHRAIALPQLSKVFPHLSFVAIGKVLDEHQPPKLFPINRRKTLGSILLHFFYQTRADFSKQCAAKCTLSHSTV